MARLVLISLFVLLVQTAGAQVSVAGGFTHDVVINPVNNGRAMAFAPDGRLFYTEIDSGQIMVVDDPTGTPGAPTVFATVSGLVTSSGNDTGLHGIAFHPDFPVSPTESSNRYIYVCHTTGTSGSPQYTIKRLTEDTGNLGQVLVGSETTVVAPFGMGSSGNRFGGRIVFGPDGRLYAGVGDGGGSVSLSGGFAQDSDDERGKIHRYADDGTVPLDNPITSNPMFALGLRNPRGMAFNPDTGDLFAVDSGNPATNGPDEVNVVVESGNYGWDSIGESGTRDMGGFSDPAWVLDDTFDPSSLAFFPNGGTTYPSEGYRNGIVYVGSEAAGGSVSRVVLTGGNERHGVARWTFAQGFNTAVRDIAFGPDGNLYVLTDTLLHRIRYTGNTSSFDPIADAGNDDAVNEGGQVTLNAGASSDGDASDVLRFTWRQVGGGSLVELNNPTDETATFTAPAVTFTQSYTFEVIVEDGNGGVDSDVVIITVHDTGNNNGGGASNNNFEPPGEGGCSSGESRTWLWVLVAGVLLASAGFRRALKWDKQGR